MVTYPRETPRGVGYRRAVKEDTLNPEAAKPAWVEQAEAYVRTLEGIEDVAIVWNGRAITEVHVVSSSSRSPRLVSRDVESLLKAKGVPVHFKTISVAQLRLTPRGEPGGPPEPVPLSTVNLAVSVPS